MDKAWVGVDAGKEFHWAHVLDASGRQLLSRKVENDEADILRLVNEALSLAEEVVWAVDQPGGSAALLLALLWERDQKVLYVPGLTVDRARDTYRGESKTDARDAHVIADQVRMRLDHLCELEPGEQGIAELQLLLARRRDLITDQSRIVTRLRETLLSLFPALERALDLNSKGPLILLTHYQTPAQLRRAGYKRIASYLKNRRVKGSSSVAHKALRVQPDPRVSPCLHRSSPPASSRSSPQRSSPSRSASRASTRNWSGVFSPARRHRSSPVCRVWACFLERSFWSL